MAEAGKGRSRKIERVRGTQDLLPEEAARWWQAECRIRKVLSVYGYGEIRTPVFESSELFRRPLGEGSDVVAKEMYEFQDKGGRLLALRPEGTAPVVRAFIERGLYAKGGRARLFYFGSIFRYDRPQAGRYREHHQLGIEAFGDPGPAQDAEVLAAGAAILSALEVCGWIALVNSSGCPECRPEYTRKLKAFLQERRERLCKDCSGYRIEHSPLRALDCKVESCRDATRDAPVIRDSLCGKCSAHHASFLSFAADSGIRIEENPRLVRGFDYYTRTCFEFIMAGKGSQDALIGGGRYDGLVEMLGGPATPAIGFGMGLERVMAVSPLKAGGTAPEVYVVAASPEAFVQAFNLASELRRAAIPCGVGIEGKSMNSQMRAANSSGARYAVITGLSEAPSEGAIVIKDLASGSQEAVSREVLPARLKGER